MSESGIGTSRLEIMDNGWILLLIGVEKSRKRVTLEAFSTGSFTYCDAEFDSK